MLHSDGIEETRTFDVCLTMVPGNSHRDVSVHLYTNGLDCSLACDELIYLMSIQNYPHSKMCLHLFTTDLFLESISIVGE